MFFSQMLVTTILILWFYKPAYCGYRQNHGVFVFLWLTVIGIFKVNMSSGLFIYAGTHCILCFIRLDIIPLSVNTTYLLTACAHGHLGSFQILQKRVLILFWEIASALLKKFSDVTLADHVIVLFQFVSNLFIDCHSICIIFHFFKHYARILLLHILSNTDLFSF